MFKIKVDSKKAERELEKYAKKVKGLPLLYAEKGAKKGYRACSKLLKKLYRLPQSASQKLERPGIRQVLKRSEELTTEGVAYTVSASAKPISLIRFVQGSKIMPRSTKKRPKRLHVAGVLGKSWATRSAFSGYGRNNNLHVFLKRDGEVERQQLPSTFALLSKKDPQKEISKALDEL